MKCRTLVPFVFVAFAGASASSSKAAPFVNLDFEKATVPTGTGQFLDASLAFPGWTAHIGPNEQSEVNYDNDSIGGPIVALYDQPATDLGIPLLDGQYDAIFGGAGIQYLPASLSQAGDVPSDARSIRLFAEGYAGSPEVSLDGIDVPMVRLMGNGYIGEIDVFGGDISAFSGTSRLLKFQSGGIVAADGIAFSPVPIPEPTGLAVLIGLPFLARHRRRAAGTRHGPAKRSKGKSLCLCECLESRQLLALTAPVVVSASAAYRRPPDYDTTIATLNWTDNNAEETGYRVEVSPNALTNWQVLPGPNNGDLPGAAGTGTGLQATQILPVGEKLYYRVSALEGGVISAPSAISSPETSIDRAVQLTATATLIGSSTDVHLNWVPISSYSPAGDQPVSYTIYARAMGSSGNWTVKGTLGASEIEYDDTVGGPTEYEVRRLNVAQQSANAFNDAKGQSQYDTWNFGYASVAARWNLPDLHRTVLLVVDQTQVDPASVGTNNAAAMSSKLDRLVTDLQGDDWSVVRIDVPRDDDLTTARNNVTYVKQQILNVRTSHPNLKSIFIIGHVPVPYSGINTAYDGHGAHSGAWSADAYYGDFDENLWIPPGNPLQNDSGSISGMKFPENDNAPGDGKFDFSFIPSDGSGDRVEAAVGRVDFSRLDWHESNGTTSVSESFLPQRYLDKDHAFRTGSLDFVPLDGNGDPLPNKAIVEDEFGPSIGIGDAWSNLSALVGPQNVKSAPWNTTLLSTDPSERYLWAFGAGPGEVINDPNNQPGNKYYSYIGKIAQSYGYAGGTVNASTEPYTYGGDGHFQAVFNVMFGSWVVDWNYPRSLLRSAVASNGIALASMWGEFPTWFLQSMSAGATLGDVFLKTINNSSNAANGYVGGSSSPADYDHSIAIALMGDPTLRMSYAKSPTWATGSFLDEYARPTWDASGGFDHFNVYRSTNSAGPFTLIGSTTDLHYFDVNLPWDPNVPTYYYMIRGASVQQTPTGSFENESTGVSLALPNDDDGVVSDYAVYNLYQGSQTFSQDLYDTLSPQVVFTLFPDTSATFSATQHLFALHIGDGAIASMPTASGVLVTQTLSIASGGTLDLADNDMIVLDGDAGTWNGAAYTGISGLVAQGRNGGSWDGTGIISSDASTGGDDLTMFAVVSAADPFNLSGTQTATFDGETVIASSVIVKFTYGGDANIDGRLNTDDYGRIDSEVAQSGSVFGWYNGDFNYDGKINVDDYAIIDGNIGRQGDPL